jgi:S-adenosylmethionine:tRNA ribosyltransferase-isomerase
MLGEIEQLDFELPPALEATAPPEVRGAGRDDVRMMVSWSSTDRIVHERFRALPRFLESGDVVVINTSGTRAAAIDGRRADGSTIAVHLSTEIDERHWVVELRTRREKSTLPLRDGAPNETIALPGASSLRLIAPHGRAGARTTDEIRTAMDGVRLWDAELELDRTIDEYLRAFGRPIRYGYVEREWPIESYQNVYAQVPGSAEMPSAGRPFTHELITSLVAHGIVVVPIVLHTGVASLEDHEAPYEERFDVPSGTATIVNAARASGGRIIAVGTTVVRALESAARSDGTVAPTDGWTDLVITPERGVRVVDGLLTGLHEPRATHLAMLAAIAGADHVRTAYSAALAERYLWHEFGDVHLLLP